MRNRKTVSVIVIAVLLGLTAMNAYAHEVPDMAKKGAIHVTMQLDAETVSGGTLTLYRAGVVDEEDGNYSFVPEDAFLGWGNSFEFEDSARLAGSLAEYVREQGMSGRTREIGSDGTVSFYDLELGLYLLVQNVAAEGYNKAAPFLVSVPMEENGSYIYDVDASPKVELTKAPVEPPEPEEPKMPAGPKLPQTGQLNWPVPLLAASGLCLLSAGWLLYFGKRKSRRGRADVEK